MTIKEMEAKALELKGLETMKTELEAEIDALRDEIKDELTARETDSLVAGAFRITWKLVTSSRIDTTALKRELPELAARYTKETAARRFLIT